MTKKKINLAAEQPEPTSENVTQYTAKDEGKTKTFIEKPRGKKAGTEPKSDNQALTIIEHIDHETMEGLLSEVVAEVDHTIGSSSFIDLELLTSCAILKLADSLVKHVSSSGHPLVKKIAQDIKVL